MARTQAMPSNVSYLSISQGRVRESYNVNENTPGAESRIVTNPQTGESKTVYEIVDAAIDGYMTGLRIYHEERVTTDFIEVTLFDPEKDETYKVSIKQNSGYGSKFLQKICSADLSLPIKIVPYMFKGENDKNVTGLNLFQPSGPIDTQFENKLEDKFFAEKPEGYPVYPGKENAKQFKLWQIEIEDYYLEKVKEQVIGQIPEKPWEAKDFGLPKKPEGAKGESEPGGDDETDGLPF